MNNRHNRCDYLGFRSLSKGRLAILIGAFLAVNAFAYPQCESDQIHYRRVVGGVCQICETDRTWYVETNQKFCFGQVSTHPEFTISLAKEAHLSEVKESASPLSMSDAITNQSTTVETINPWVAVGNQVRQTDRYWVDSQGRLIDRITGKYPRTAAGHYFNKFYQPDASLSGGVRTETAVASNSARANHAEATVRARPVNFTPRENPRTANPLENFTCRGTFFWGSGRAVEARLVLRRRGASYEVDAHEYLNGGHVSAEAHPAFGLAALGADEKRFLARTYDKDVSDKVAWVQKLVSVGAPHGNAFLIYRWFGADGQYLGSSGRYGLHSFACTEGPAIGVSLKNGPLEITEVYQDSVAETAGLQPGDIIHAINGKTVSDFSSLKSALAGFKRGDRAQISIERKGEELQKTTRIGDLADYGMDDEIPGIGISYDLMNTEGFRITKIVPDGVAEKAGFKVGDLLTRLNNFKTTDSYYLARGLSDSRREKKFKATVLRNGKPIEIEYDTSDSLAKGFDGAFLGNGIRIGSVVTGGAAYQSGLREDDVLTEWEGRPVRVVEEWISQLRAHKPGDQIRIKFIRNGVVYEQTIALGRLTDY